MSRYSPATGAYLGAARGGLAWPKALLFRPQGDLLVGTVNAVQVTRFNPSTGAFLGVATTGGDLLAPSYLLQTGDLIPPTVSHTLSTAPNAAGWHRADVQVQLSAVDDTAVASLTYQVGDGAPVTVAGAAASVTLSMEGIHRVRYSARDTSGVKSATGEVTVRLDKTAPQIAGSRSPAANAFGWNNADVTVSFTASDTASGIASLTEPVTLDGEGAGQSVTGTALDLAGNSASTTVADIRIDRTAPVVTYTGGGVYTVDQEVDFRCSASDSLSGVASDTCQGPITGPAYTFALGPHSYSATATDRAGNTGSGSGSFTVRVTPASLVNLVRRFVANEGIATSLVQKLENAAAAEARGDLGAKAGLLAAFINEVEAQRGKTLTPAQASVLIALAGAL